MATPTTAAFIDLATFDIADKNMYGGDNFVPHFVRETKKSIWFSQIPTKLTRQGNGNWDSSTSFTISRHGDYLVNTWLQVELPTVIADPNELVRWVPNIGHLMINNISVTFNDLVAQKFSGHWLNFWSAFTVPQSKRAGYNKMVGNIDALTLPTETLNAYTLTVPLPFWFSKDLGMSLPTAILPYNDMKINVQFNDKKKLLHACKRAPGFTEVASGSQDTNINDLTSCELWANYVVVSNDERKKMTDDSRDILIDQVQENKPQCWSPSTENENEVNMHFSHPVKTLFYGIHNTTLGYINGNYSSVHPACVGVGKLYHKLHTHYKPVVKQATLMYDNTNRLENMTEKYFSLIQPFYHAPSIPEVNGMSMYSYALDIASPNPCGSSNHGKIHTVNWKFNASNSAITTNTDGYKDVNNNPLVNSFEIRVFAHNWNILHISNGVVHFPVMNLAP